MEDMAKVPQELAMVELAMQELESMEAPGFWTGFFGGAAIVIGLSAIGFT